MLTLDETLYSPHCATRLLQSQIRKQRWQDIFSCHSPSCSNPEHCLPETEAHRTDGTLWPASIFRKPIGAKLRSRRKSGLSPLHYAKLGCMGQFCLMAVARWRVYQIELPHRFPFGILDFKHDQHPSAWQFFSPALPNWLSDQQLFILSLLVCTA